MERARSSCSEGNRVSRSWWRNSHSPTSTWPVNRNKGKYRVSLILHPRGAVSLDIHALRSNRRLSFKGANASLSLSIQVPVELS